MTEQPGNDVQLKEFSYQDRCPLKQRVTNGKTTEHSTLIEDQDSSSQDTARLYKAALGISWFSILFSLGTGVAGIVLSVSGKSEALFAYGLDAVLDSFSSVAVVWRFHGSTGSVYSEGRERKACIAIGFLFLVSAASLIIKSLHAILTETHEAKSMVLYDSFALTCGIISVLIAVAKIVVGLKINSQALYTDSIITMVGAVSCFAGVTGLELYTQDTDLWYLDSLFGIICGCFLLLFGLKLLYSKLKSDTEKGSADT